MMSFVPRRGPEQKTGKNTGAPLIEAFAWHQSIEAKPLIVGYFGCICIIGCKYAISECVDYPKMNLHPNGEERRGMRWISF